MKKTLIIISILTYFLNSLGQDSLYQKRKLSSTEINVLFSFYTQDGNHSAITGGEGTEKLQVYAPHITYAQEWDSANSVYFNAGIDIITSASTDRIDYVMSSASYQDANIQVDAGYGHYFKKSRVDAGFGGSLSIESDYLSRGVNIWLSHTTPSGMTNYSMTFHAFFDDLRWGRLNPDYRRPVTLIYPVELRDTNWFDIYMRYSYNLGLGFERIINRRITLGIYPGLIIQDGLLSTPFHRVYFQDQDGAKVENLPTQRIRIPVGFKLNAYLGSSLILNSYYRFYWDDFDITASTLELAAFFKINPYWTPSFSMRYYHQTGAKYFKPFKEHLPGDQYYTSDYDLSSFHSLEASAGIRFAPFKRMFGNWSFQEVDLKYSFYWRSDGLKAHFISSFFGFGGTRK